MGTFGARILSNWVDDGKVDVTRAENAVEALHAEEPYFCGETEVKKVLVLAAGMVVSVAAIALAEDTTENKKAEVTVDTVTADEIAKEFKRGSSGCVLAAPSARVRPPYRPAAAAGQPHCRTTTAAGLPVWWVKRFYPLTMSVYSAKVSKAPPPRMAH
jgi:hypothetical protein